MRHLLMILALAMTLPLGGELVAGEMAVKVIDQQPPSELGDAIRQTLRPRAVQLSAGDKPIYEFWFCGTIPAQSRPALASDSLKAIKETTLLGAARVGEGNRDYKDNDVAPGVYTMRFGLQPQDGDHLGTADHAYFAVLIPAKYDPKPDAFTSYKPMVKASGRDVPSGHPNVLSLRPVSSEPGDLPTLNEPAEEHKSVVLRLPATVEGAAEKASLVFELVYSGKGHM